MARVTFVKKAQPRYRTVPVLNPDGTPKRVPVMSKNGTQRVSKRGPVFMAVTVADKTRPLPEETCDACHQPIKVGTPYKHVSPKSGPYGGRKRSRHQSCPTWAVWELSNSWSARVAQVIDGFSLDFDTLESPEDAASALEALADEIEGLAEESREAASNIEDGFGHSTSVSEDAETRADELDEWASTVRDADIPDLPEPEEGDCPQCDGSGLVDNPDIYTDPAAPEEVECNECEGTGQTTPDEPTDEQMDQWRSEVEDACEVVNESPV